MPKLPRPVREDGEFVKRRVPIPMWTNKEGVRVRQWPLGAKYPLPINTPVLAGKIHQKEGKGYAFCSLNPPVSAGWIALEDLSPAPVVVAPPAE